MSNTILQPARCVAGTLPPGFSIEAVDAIALGTTDEQANLLAAMPNSPLFRLICGIPTGETFEAAFGFEPDVLAACRVTAANPIAIAEILDLDDNELRDLLTGETPLSLSDALLVCRSLGWPLAMFICDGKTTFHPPVCFRQAAGAK